MVSAEGAEGCEEEGHEGEDFGTGGRDAGLCESGGVGEVGASGGGEGDCEGLLGEGDRAMCMRSIPSRLPMFPIAVPFKIQFVTSIPPHLDLKLFFFFPLA